MSEMSLLQRVEEARFSVFKWRVSLTLLQKIALALGFAVITGICAQLKLFVSWSLVPITMQTLPVLLAGVLLGHKWGGVSMGMYILGGIAGIPWFSGFTAGPAALFGPTGGYLLGFILTALVLGYITDRFPKGRSLLPMALSMITANAVLIYIPGILVLGLYLSLIKGSYPGFTGLLNMGVIPFIIGDGLKIAIAAVIAAGVTPKKNFIN